MFNFLKISFTKKIKYLTSFFSFFKRLLIQGFWSNELNYNEQIFKIFSEYVFSKNITKLVTIKKITNLKVEQ